MSAFVEGVDRALDRGVGRDEQHERLRARLRHALEHLEAVDAGQVHVAEDRVEFVAGEHLQPEFARAGRLNRELLLYQELGEVRANDRLVVDHENGGQR